jgi:hypothetical protein
VRIVVCQQLRPLTAIRQTSDLPCPDLMSNTATRPPLGSRATLAGESDGPILNGPLACGTAT